MASITLSENEKYTFGRITGASVILGASDHVHAEQKFRKGLEITGSGTIGTEGSGLRLKGDARFGGPNADSSLVQIFADTSHGLEIKDSTGTNERRLVLINEYSGEEGVIRMYNGGGETVRIRANNHSFLSQATNTLSICTPTEADELNVNGDVNADNISGGISDQRLKKNINDISGSLDSINSLRCVTFEWIDDYANNRTTRLGTKYGFIAQEVESILPSIVGTKAAEDSEYHGYKNLSYTQVVPILVEAVKELTARIKVLEGNS